MYSDLIEVNDKLIKKVMDATNTDYEVIRLFNKAEDKMETYINTDNLVVALEDMLVEYDHMKEMYEDLKQDVEDNYRPIPPEEQI